MYNSEVGISLWRSDYDELVRRAKIADEQAGNDLSHEKSISKFIEDGYSTVMWNKVDQGIVTLHWEQCDWSDTDNVTSFIQSCIDEFVVDFIRIGDADDDIETDYCLGAGRLMLERKISIY